MQTGQVLTPQILLHGYSIGIFPMAEHRDAKEIFWVDPKHRGVVPLDGFHISRSLRRRLLKADYQVRINTDFDGVVSACADRKDTWINAEIQSLYNQLHHMTAAHSLEIWDAQALIGGVYGVALGGAFFGESMFSRRTDASKIALAFLVDRLNQAGFTLFDTQFLTPHLASLGAIEVPRARYQTQLGAALKTRAQFSAPPIPTAQDVVQRNTQRS